MGSGRKNKQVSIGISMDILFASFEIGLGVKFTLNIVYRLKVYLNESKNPKLKPGKTAI
jgi:hypothetical protein